MTSANLQLPSELAKRFPVLVIAGVASDTAVARSADGVVRPFP